MKTFWYATLVTLTSLVLGALASQSFGADHGRNFGGSMRSGGQLRSVGLNAAVSRQIGGASGVSGIKPPVRALPPIVRSKPPIKTLPVGPIKTLPPIVKPPKGPIKPPIVGPIGPIKPPVGPIKPPGPIGPIKPPVVGPVVPIGPIKPLPPICPPYCPPKHCPPICPPWNPGGYCGPWSPLPPWSGCYRPCTPICISLPTYVSTPVVTETVVVDSPAVAESPMAESPAAAPAVTDVASDEKLMQLPVGATLQLNEKSLGEKQGQVVLQVDSIAVPAQVNDWKAEQVNVTLPMFGLTGPTKAQIWLMRADGQVANKLAVELLPAQAPAEGAASATTAMTAAVTQN